MPVVTDRSAVAVSAKAYLTKRVAATGEIFERVLIRDGAGDPVPPRVVLRRAGQPAESYAKGENHMVRMKFSEGGSVEGAAYAAGETVEVDGDHAKRAFRLGHGWPVDDSGARLPAVDAQRALRLRLSDVAMLPQALRDEIAAGIAAEKAAAEAEAGEGA